MLKKLSQLFVIKTRFEAFAIIYAIAVGAVARGTHYLEAYPGLPGYLLFAACTGAVFMAGGKILEAVGPKIKKGEERRRVGDRRAPMSAA